MTRRLGSGEPCFDRDRTLYVLRDSLGKADAFITAAEDLIEQTEGETEQTEGGGEGDDDDVADDVDDNRSRRRNHIEYLVESAKRAVRAALAAAAELDTRRMGA